MDKNAYDIEYVCGNDIIHVDSYPKLDRVKDRIFMLDKCDAIGLFGKTYEIGKIIYDFSEKKIKVELKSSK